MHLRRARFCGVSSPLQRSSAPRSIHQFRLEGPGCCRGIALFEKELSQLFASWDDRSWSYRELLDSVFVIGRTAEHDGGLLGLIDRLRRPSQNFSPPNADLGCPVAVS